MISPHDYQEARVLFSEVVRVGDCNKKHSQLNNPPIILART